MYNEMFKFYGKDVYKIGVTKNIKQRGTSFSTSYIEPVEFVFISKIFNNKYDIENKVHKILGGYRINKNREFFQVPLDIIKTTIIKLEDN